MSGLDRSGVRKVMEEYCSEEGVEVSSTIDGSSSLTKCFRNYHNDDVFHSSGDK